MQYINNFYLGISIAFNVIIMVNSYKYKVCVVDGKGVFKRSLKYCPDLDVTTSDVECVVALDRFDCLRRIHKGKADFGVFSPEDLISAANSEIDLVITNELRFIEDAEYAYEVVAVISNKAQIKNKNDVQNKRLCHPGYGYESDWTRIESNYFESTMVTPQCNSTLTVIENRIKASSEFFKSACKAGPWVYNTKLDRYLKEKYFNLCKSCDDPYRCSMNDKYWGRKGSLLCLTDGAGDISWARLPDVLQHFGITSNIAEANINDYSLLCPDGTVIPINNSRPCIWLAKPWPVVASKPDKANGIQNLLSTLNSENQAAWKFSLLNLLESFSLNIKMLDSANTIGAYLHKTKGFLNAYSFSSCHPPRTVRICTTSTIETAKCSWLRESAAIYGIEPDLDCLKADNKTHCMMAINDNVADITIIPPDLLHTAKTRFKLNTLFYETTNDSNKYIVVVVTRTDSKLRKLEDFRGVKTCFPSYDGIAWYSVMEKLKKNNILDKKSLCSGNNDLESFFGSVIISTVSENQSDIIWKNDTVNDLNALQNLANKVCDVAFVSRNSLNKFDLEIQTAGDPQFHEESNFRILCMDESNDLCHLSWAPVGQAMIRSNHSNTWMNDTFNVFMQLEELFGRNSKYYTKSFSLFGRYDGVPNLLFHDSTEKLNEKPILKNTDKMNLFYENIIGNATIYCSTGNKKQFNFKIIIVFIIILLFSANCSQ